MLPELSKHVIRFNLGIGALLSIPPLFKFGFNPSLIDGILNVLPNELLLTIIKSQKNGHGNAQIAKIFCDL